MQELHPCGAETIYMDPDYLQEVVKGMLKVHVRNAAGLSPQGENRECNPFVTVAVGPSAGLFVPSGLLNLCVSLTLMAWLVHAHYMTRDQSECISFGQDAC